MGAVKLVTTQTNDRSNQKAEKYVKVSAYLSKNANIKFSYTCYKKTATEIWARERNQVTILVKFWEILTNLYLRRDEFGSKGAGAIGDML